LGCGRRPEGGAVVAGVLRDTRAADREMASEPSIRRRLDDTLAEPYRQGVGGVGDDVLAVARPWGFEPAEITATVGLWQGKADVSGLPALGRELAAALPRCTARYLPGEGHFLVHWREILATLAEALREGGA